MANTGRPVIELAIASVLIVAASASVALAQAAPAQPTPPTTPAPPAVPTPPADPNLPVPTAPAAPTMPAVPVGPVMPAPPTMPAAYTPTTPALAPNATDAMPTPDVSATSATPPASNVPKVPKMGDFDAGGNVRLPNGPDAKGHYASFNWVAVDAKGRYYLARTVWLSGIMPLAIIHPSTISETNGTMVDTVDPHVFGGLAVSLNANLPSLPSLPFMSENAKKTEIGLVLTGSYMPEKAVLLSDKDFPLFVGNFQPGFTGGLNLKLRLGNAVDFALTPSWVYQSGTVESHEAVQVPTSLIIALGQLIKLSADLGVFTGDRYSFSGDAGGRIYLGGALDVKISRLQFHAGAGVASLLTGGDYPTIADSIYFDLNVKFVK
jgi:hypothetical protein